MWELIGKYILWNLLLVANKWTKLQLELIFTTFHCNYPFCRSVIWFLRRFIAILFPFCNKWQIYWNDQCKLLFEISKKLFDLIHDKINNSVVMSRAFNEFITVNSILWALYVMNVVEIYRKLFGENTSTRTYLYPFFIQQLPSIIPSSDKDSFSSSFIPK